MINRTQIAALLAALLVGGGIALAGWFVGHAYMTAREGGGTVTVKGLAEREVEADIAIWPLTLTATGDSLQEVQATLDADRAKVLTFLREAGFVDASIEVQSPLVTDRATRYHAGPAGNQPRYIVSQSVVLRTPNIELVQATSQETGRLIADGVTLGFDPSGSRAGMGPAGPRFIFSRLNDIKPGMLAAATTNARAAAEQFAADAGSELGRIQHARQGVFQIRSRDGLNVPEWTQPRKKVRVVSTLTFRLVD
jgi:hypothetical protein